jgi:hypothetical protein
MVPWQSPGANIIVATAKRPPLWSVPCNSFFFYFGETLFNFFLFLKKLDKILPDEFSFVDPRYNIFFKYHPYQINFQNLSFSNLHFGKVLKSV